MTKIIRCHDDCYHPGSFHSRYFRGIYEHINNTRKTKSEQYRSATALFYNSFDPGRVVQKFLAEVKLCLCKATPAIFKGCNVHPGPGAYEQVLRTVQADGCLMKTGGGVFFCTYYGCIT
jgi:hypothetical protein